jgi:hypothetical protein
VPFALCDPSLIPQIRSSLPSGSIQKKIPHLAALALSGGATAEKSGAALEQVKQLEVVQDFCKNWSKNSVVKGAEIQVLTRPNNLVMRD